MSETTTVTENITTATGDRSGANAAGHTPGPWRIDPGHSVLSIVAGDERIAAVSTVYYWQPFTATDAANARLIAAAPELLATLKRAWLALSWCAPLVPDNDPMREKCATVWDECQAAIAKAEGRGSPVTPDPSNAAE